MTQYLIQMMKRNMRDIGLDYYLNELIGFNLEILELSVYGEKVFEVILTFLDHNFEFEFEFIYSSDGNVINRN